MTDLTLSAPVAPDRLTATDWALALGVDPRSFRKRRLTSCGLIVTAAGTSAAAYRAEDLPSDYRTRLEAALAEHGISSPAALVERKRRLGHAAVACHVWQPSKKFAEFPPASQEKALKVRDCMSVYFAALDAGHSARHAERAAVARWTSLFGQPCTDRSIRNWAQKIIERGGIETAPNEAFLDNKAVPHVRQRLEAKIPADLIAEFKARCVMPGMEHISGAFRTLEIDWMMGREVPGLGTPPAPGQPFPYKIHQLRKFAPSTPARRLGSHGKARARREALPHLVTTTSQLHRGQMYLLDDTRIDMIVLDDLTGQPRELKSYWMIDLATRRIEGYLIREAGNIRSTDVTALVARVLRGCGVAPLGAPFQTVIKFERGTVACSPAEQSFLEGIFGGRLRVSRTSMDGGRNFSGDLQQDRSGHWMGKGHVESLMRTLAFFFQGIPGQRGGDYRRQPGHLGLKGRERDTNYLLYNKGGQIHDAALQAYAGRALEYLDNGLDERLRAFEERHIHRVGERLRITSLLTASQAMEKFREIVAYYNCRTNHRMEGFARIEFIQPDGRPGWRMESPDERAAHLDALQPLERLSPADAAFLVRTVTKTVTVRPNGVTMDLAPYKGLRFWKPDSLACHAAERLATLETKFIAAFDPEQILHGQTPEIYLLRGESSDWRPGQPARFIEALPLATPVDRADPAAMARELEQVKRQEQRYAHELTHAAAPIIAERLAAARDNSSRLRDVITTTLRTGPTVQTDMPVPSGQPGSRAAQRAVEAPAFAATLGTVEEITAAQTDEY